eukprot:2756500-Rhodomonas_salina.1
MHPSRPNVREKSATKPSSRSTSRARLKRIASVCSPSRICRASSLSDRESQAENRQCQRTQNEVHARGEEGARTNLVAACLMRSIRTDGDSALLICFVRLLKSTADKNSSPSPSTIARSTKSKSRIPASGISQAPFDGNEKRTSSNLELLPMLFKAEVEGVVSSGVVPVDREGLEREHVEVAVVQPEGWL